MARSVNKVILVGNIGKDAETRFTKSGTPVSSFSIATSSRRKDGDEWVEDTQWHNVILWKQENVATYLTKGKQVYVEGRIQTRSYEDKEGKKVYTTEIVGEQVVLLGGQGKEESTTSAPAPAAKAAGAGNPRAGSSRKTSPPPAEVLDDDIPF
jgi:single-strand DNA-binding protein